MKRRDGTVIRLTSQSRGWSHRVLFAMLIAVSFGLMLLGKADAVVVERLRSAVSDAVTPALNLIAEPIATVRNTIEEVEAVAQLKNENAELRAANERLLEWQAAARKLRAENAALRDLLNLRPDPRTSYVTGRIVADVGGAFARTLLVAAGAEDGVKKNAAAVTGNGLAGRVIEVGNHSARVLLVTDINSRIPVVVDETRDPALIAGTNGRRMDLLYLDPDASVTAGQLLVTSGRGGLFPPGIPVGRIVEAGGERITAAPMIDWQHLEHLRLVDYALDDSLLPQGFGAPAASVLPGQIPESQTRPFREPAPVGP